MQVLPAIVKFSAGKVFAGKFGDRQSIKLEFAKGELVDIWFDAGDDRYCSLKKGEAVQVIRNGDKYTVAMPDDAESMAFRRAADRFGLGLYLYEKD